MDTTDDGNSPMGEAPELGQQRVGDRCECFNNPAPFGPCPVHNPPAADLAFRVKTATGAAYRLQSLGATANYPFTLLGHLAAEIERLRGALDRVEAEIGTWEQSAAEKGWRKHTFAAHIRAALRGEG